MSIPQLFVLGIGKSKAAALLAAFELGRRISGQSSADRIRIESPQDVLQIMQRHLHALTHEEFWVLHLNAGNRLISKKCVTVGILNSSLVHPRECFAEALVQHSAAVIFVHNHPSGNPEPSQEDIAITRQLVQSGEILGIKGPRPYYYCRRSRSYKLCREEPLVNNFGNSACPFYPRFSL